AEMGRWAPHFVADAGWLKTDSQTGVEALIDLRYAQAPTVLDNSRTLPQGDGGTGPAFTRRAVGSERNLIVLDSRDVLHDAFSIRCPRIDAESEVRSDFHAITLTSSLPS